MTWQYRVVKIKQGNAFQYGIHGAYDAGTEMLKALDTPIIDGGEVEATLTPSQA